MQSPNERSEGIGALFLSSAEAKVFRENEFPPPPFAVSGEGRGREREITSYKQLFLQPFPSPLPEVRGDLFPSHSP